MNIKVLFPFKNDTFDTISLAVRDKKNNTIDINFGTSLEVFAFCR